MTADERARLDSDVDAVLGEVLGLEQESASSTSNGRGVFGRAASACRRVGITIAVAGRRVKSVLTRDNAQRAVETSAAWGKLAAKYGADVAKDALKRRLRRVVDEKIGKAIGG